MTIHKIYEAKTDRSEKRKQGRSCSVFNDLTSEATHHCSHNPPGYTQVKPYTRARIWGGENLWTPSADLTVPLRPSEIPPLEFIGIPPLEFHWNSSIGSEILLTVIQEPPPSFLFEISAFLYPCNKRTCTKKAMKREKTLLFVLSPFIKCGGLWGLALPEAFLVALDLVLACGIQR